MYPALLVNSSNLPPVCVEVGVVALEIVGQRCHIACLPFHHGLQPLEELFHTRLTGERLRGVPHASRKISADSGER